MTRTADACVVAKTLNWIAVSFYVHRWRVFCVFGSFPSVVSGVGHSSGEETGVSLKTSGRSRSRRVLVAALLSTKCRRFMDTALSELSCRAAA